MSNRVVLTDMESGKKIIFNRRQFLVVSLDGMSGCEIVMKYLGPDGNVIRYRVRETFDEIQRMVIGEPQ